MKYAQKYNNLKHMEIVEEHLLYTDNEKICNCCGNITHFVDIGFESPFCSDECYEKVSNEYLKISYMIK